MQGSYVSDTGVSRANEETSWLGDFGDKPPSEAAPTEANQFLPSVRFIVGMAALGIALALGWRYSGLEERAFTPVTVTAQPASAAAAVPAPESDLARMVREVEGLKETVNELISANHQLTATVAALQAGQQELKQRASVNSNSWHADAATMKFRMVPQSKGTTGSATPRPAPAPRAEVRNAPKPADVAPLQLTSPRP